MAFCLAWAVSLPMKPRWGGSPAPCRLQMLEVAIGLAFQQGESETSVALALAVLLTSFSPHLSQGQNSFKEDSIGAI